MDEISNHDLIGGKRIKPGQHVIISLRKMIAEGHFQPGERIGEVAMATALGVSRMPIRTALRALETEGLVVKLGARGYTTRSINISEIHGAIEVRGVLEGLAAKRLAKRGLTAKEERDFEKCLAKGEEIFVGGELAEGALDLFYVYNLVFHDLLISASDNPSIASALAGNNHLPFASAAALALNWSDRPSEYPHLLGAHQAHCDVIQAVLQRDADEAERIMRDHAWAAIGNERVFNRTAVA